MTEQLTLSLKRLKPRTYEGTSPEKWENEMTKSFIKGKHLYVFL